MRQERAGKHGDRLCIIRWTDGGRASSFPRLSPPIGTAWGTPQAPDGTLVAPANLGRGVRRKPGRYHAAPIGGRRHRAGIPARCPPTIVGISGGCRWLGTTLPPVVASARSILRPSDGMARGALPTWSQRPLAGRPCGLYRSIRLATGNGARFRRTGDTRPGFPRLSGAPSQTPPGERMRST